jgi:hypothetical protein
MNASGVHFGHGNLTTALLQVGWRKGTSDGPHSMPHRLEEQIAARFAIFRPC